MSIVIRKERTRDLSEQQQQQGEISEEDDFVNNLKRADGQNWSKGCQFLGYNVFEFKCSDAMYCRYACKVGKICNHFTWSPANGGICYLKKTSYNQKLEPVKADNENFVCGTNYKTSVVLPFYYSR
jgi:hypothetical protein